ncbi:MAG: alcohol dehydrogenase catalytic domain-containing protein [Actinomycetia bacterium]|nr:alcohol dehydrogenase catalytic domain-containing protein [Actinomycetes bacterium]
MKALVYEGPGQIGLRDIDDPEPGPGEVLLSVTSAGVCGTDRHIVAGELGVSPGTVPGHEIAGTITDLGPGVEGWSVGDRVASFGQVACGRCLPCASGRSNLCRKPAILGMARQGGFAERVALPTGGLIALPDSVADPIGAIASDAIASPFHALTTIGGLQAGEIVVIIGAGGLGLHAVQLARLCGAARVVAVDPVAEAREAALAVGADAALDPTEEDEPDRALRRLARGSTLVLECVGHSETVELGLAALAPGGRLVIVGVGRSRPTLPPLVMFSGSELSVLGSFGSTPTEIDTVLALISSGRLDVSRSVQREVPLSDAAPIFTEPFGPARTVIVPDPKDQA